MDLRSADHIRLPPRPQIRRALKSSATYKEKAKAKERDESQDDDDGDDDGEVEAEEEDMAEIPPANVLSASIHSSAAAFVKGGLQDACEDSCAICLEPFSDDDPSTITTCKHDYHLQCILEWAQRSKECPMCLQPLHFEDPNSQELLDAVEHERSVRTSLEQGIHFQVPSFVNYADFEERIMQHLAHQLARRGSLHNRISNIRHDVFIREQASRSAMGETEEMQSSPSYSTHGGRNRGHTTMQRHETVSDTLEEGQSRALEISSLSGSLKSRFLVASSKCKETLTKTTRNFRERWQGRNTATSGLEDHSLGSSPDHVVRHTLSQVSPESLLKGDDIPTTSSSSDIEERNREFPARRYESVENRVNNGVPFDPPSEAV